MKNNILVIEDDPFANHLYELVFNKAGYNIIHVEDGDKVLDLLYEINVSLIILDINLKNTFLDGERTNGIQLSRHIKQNRNFSSIPILLISAYQQKNGNKDYLEESLADNYIIKPILDFNKLIEITNKLVIS